MAFENLLAVYDIAQLGNRPLKAIAAAEKLKDLTIALHAAHVNSQCDKRCIDSQFGLLPELFELKTFIRNIKVICVPFRSRPTTLLYTSRGLRIMRWLRFKLRRYLLGVYRCALHHGYTTTSFEQEFSSL